MIIEQKYYEIQCDECKDFLTDDIEPGTVCSCSVEAIENLANDNNWVEYHERHYCPYCAEKLRIKQKIEEEENNER